MSERDYGVIRHWNDGGYGFIRPDGAERDIFFHVSAVSRGEPRIGDRVSFVTGEDRNQRPCARSILFEAEKSAP
jgi:cold shock CspA family protein